MGVVVLDLAAVRQQTVVLHENGNQVRRCLQIGLVLVGSQRGQSLQPLLSGTFVVEFALLFFGGFTNPALDRGVVTTTKCHGCMLAPLGAVTAVRRQFS